MPRSLYAGVPSSHVDWESGAVSLLSEARVWPEVGRARRAGVSSFGISGTNAHVILEQAPTMETATETDSAGALPAPLVLTARSGPALHAWARQLTTLLSDEPTADPTVVARSLVSSRSTFDHRAVVLGSDVAELRVGLSAMAAGVPDARVVVGSVGRTVGGVGFVFPGQGSQRLGMGRELYGAFPVFADAFDEVCGHLDVPVRDVVWGSDAELLNQTRYAQTGLFAVEVALFRLLESWGVRPDHVAGHSVGEVVAAHVSGVLSLADACRLVSVRGRLMQELPVSGAMFAVDAAEDVVRPLVGGDVEIAAVNGPSAVVVSGAEPATKALAARLAELGHRTTRLKVSHAFHSALMRPIVDELALAGQSLVFGEPSVPGVSTVTGGRVAGDWGDAGYWARQVVEPVLFG
ncbi:acyltransferase domain-containing protein, partial [Kibdelosporangium lantanae]